MTDLDAIRARHAAAEPHRYVLPEMSQAHADRGVLLATLDRLAAELAALRTFRARVEGRDA